MFFVFAETPDVMDFCCADATQSKEVSRIFFFRNSSFLEVFRFPEFQSDAILPEVSNQLPALVDQERSRWNGVLLTSFGLSTRSPARPRETMKSCNVPDQKK